METTKKTRLKVELEKGDAVEIHGPCGRFELEWSEFDSMPGGRVDLWVWHSGPKRSGLRATGEWTEQDLNLELKEAEE